MVGYKKDPIQKDEVFFYLERIFSNYFTKAEKSELVAYLANSKSIAASLAKLLSACDSGLQVA